MLFREANGRPLSKETVRTRLDLSPEVLDHMLSTLVRRGRLVAVVGCEGCEICPLKPVCAGVPAPTQKAYALPRPVLETAFALEEQSPISEL